MKRALVIAVLVLSGCKGDKSSGSGSGSGSGAGSGSAHREKKEDPRAAAEKEARDFLARWTDLQKKLDFAAYAALYEPKTFRGVKRTARGKTSELDFAAWKADRKRMFDKKFEIATEPIEVDTWLDKGSRLKGGISVVRFTQRWKSGTYADHGVKVLHLWHQKPGQLLIVYEDLLNSEPGWDRVADGVEVADLAAPPGPEEALALWKKLAPTGANYHEKLAAIPADPAVRRPMALALIAGGDFLCEETVEYSECGGDYLAWKDFNLKSTFADACLRRRLAVWALAELDPADIEKVESTLTDMIEMEEPETELQPAALAAFERGPEPVRLRAYKVAMVKGLEEKMNVHGLSEAGLISAARDIGIDAAAGELDRSRHLEVLAALVNDDEQMDEETRSSILDDLAEIKDPVSTEALRKLADGGASCALGMAAAEALEQRGDGSFIPRRGLQDDEDDARSALCMSVHDGDEKRARALLASFVGPEGVRVTRINKSDWDHIEAEDAGPGDDESEPDAGPDVVTDLDEIAALVAQTIEFENSQPEWEKREMSFAKAKDGGLRLDAFEIYTYSGCGC